MSLLPVRLSCLTRPPSQYLPGVPSIETGATAGLCHTYHPSMVSHHSHKLAELKNFSHLLMCPCGSKNQPLLKVK
ncbi:hypothetical protein EmuJ_000508700 [Echinococcus multilocularis]|uniref:Uncharacterized protein n=1 Tax=Echinococcus multilocularis TaxID=6211 RepID=A0A068Y698_ECHMU|nr:hypothetical protein EmuJ_000508700 [Echinococcus multilocularis]